MVSIGRLLHCKGCGRHWCHAADATGVEWFTPAAWSFPADSRSGGSGTRSRPFRRFDAGTAPCVSQRKSQEWINPPDWPRPVTTSHTTWLIHSLPRPATLPSLRTMRAGTHALTARPTGHTLGVLRPPSPPTASPPEVIAAAWLHDLAEDCPTDEAGSREILKGFEVDFGPPGRLARR